MNIQHHERTAQIKKLSRYLCVTLTWLGYLLWLLWPLMLLPLFPDVKISLAGEDKLAHARSDLAYPMRVALVIGSGVCLFFTQQFVHHARDFMRHFSRGEIFNSSAIQAARKSLSKAMVLFWLNIVIQGMLQIYKAIGAPHPTYSINPNTLIFGFLLFGLMYVLLWTLEIGHDLNEESELTV